MRAPASCQDSEDWSGSALPTSPIGQGVSVTTLQMASVYQAIANDGVRIAPRIVESVDRRRRHGDRDAGARADPGRLHETTADR